MPVVSKEAKKSTPGATLNPSRKFVVRLSIATGATLSTLIGAQTLALMDVPKTASVPTAPSVQASAATATAPNAAPQIVIVRNAGSPVAPVTAIPRRVVQPPPPAPESDIAPAPAQPEPVSQSSR